MSWYGDNSIKFLEIDYFKYNWSYFTMCLPVLMYHRVNECVTGMCTLVLAAERYIVFCQPQNIERFLSKTNRKVIYTIMTIVILCVTCFEATLQMFNFYFFWHSDCMYGALPGFYGQLLSTVLSAILFYVIPAIASVTMYALIIKNLLQIQTQRSRNMIVTFALACSCLLWAILWGLKYVFQLVQFITWQFFDYEWFYENPTAALIVSNQTAKFFPVFSSVTNPFVLLIVCKVFREPAVDLVRKCLNMEKPAGNDDEDPESDSM